MREISKFDPVCPCICLSLPPPFKKTGQAFRSEFSAFYPFPSLVFRVHSEKWYLKEKIYIQILRAKYKREISSKIIEDLRVQ
jgi:hypothetical protein